jgi:hypothetical protein
MYKYPIIETVAACILLLAFGITYVMPGDWIIYVWFYVIAITVFGWRLFRYNLLIEVETPSGEIRGGKMRRIHDDRTGLSWMEIDWGLFRKYQLVKDYAESQPLFKGRKKLYRFLEKTPEELVPLTINKEKSLLDPIDSDMKIFWAAQYKQANEKYKLMDTLTKYTPFIMLAVTVVGMIIITQMLLGGFTQTAGAMSGFTSQMAEQNKAMQNVAEALAQVAMNLKGVNTPVPTPG